MLDYLLMSMAFRPVQSENEVLAEEPTAQHPAHNTNFGFIFIGLSRVEQNDLGSTEDRKCLTSVFAYCLLHVALLCIFY